MTGLEQLEAARAVPDWEGFEHHQGGALAGFALLKGTEFHCCLFPGFRLRRAEMREFLRPLFERHGFLTTRVAHDDLANQRFNKAFGFELPISSEAAINMRRAIKLGSSPPLSMRAIQYNAASGSLPRIDLIKADTKS